jgi:hypothetical protein
MAGYWIFAGLVVLEPSESDAAVNETRQAAAARGQVQFAGKATPSLDDGRPEEST